MLIWGKLEANGPWMKYHAVMLMPNVWSLMWLQIQCVPVGYPHRHWNRMTIRSYPMCHRAFPPDSLRQIPFLHLNGDTKLQWKNRKKVFEAAHLLLIVDTIGCWISAEWLLNGCWISDDGMGNCDSFNETYCSYSAECIRWNQKVGNWIK